MDAKDFRIGNLIYYHISDPLDDPQDYDVLETIDYDDLRCFEQYEDNSEYKVIPLTEEWLLKFGFEKEEADWFRKVYDADIQNTRQEIAVNISSFACAIGDTYESGDFGYAGAPLQYVHQLQNLYFALTGTELTINEQ